MTNTARRGFFTAATLVLALSSLHCGDGSSDGGSEPGADAGSDSTATDGATFAEAGDTGVGGDTAPPVNAPTWLTGKPLNEWFEIPGTAGAGGSAVGAFSGFGLKDSNSELVIAAAGGHTDSSDNRVVSLVLQADAPKWVQRSAPSTTVATNVPYYPDGLPSSRHLYHAIHVIESRDRVFLYGNRGNYGVGGDFPTVDAFDLKANKWDPAGTWDSIPSGYGYGAVRVRATDDVYTHGFGKWDAKTGKWSKPITVTSSARWPIANDSKRNELFALQWGDGQGFEGPTVRSSRTKLATGTQADVTFNSSPAFTQFNTDAPTYSAMDYDPDNDRFLFYCGQGAGKGRIFVIAPNATNVWDMSILPLGPGTVIPSDPTGAGVNSRFRYVPALKGFVLLASPSTNLFFIRTA